MVNRPGWQVVPILLLFFFLALDSMVDDSPTMDEQNHLARGLAFLRTGDPRLSLEHPPLVNALSALPLLTMPEIRLPLDHPSWERPEGWYEFADLLLWRYNDDARRMIFLARVPILFLTIGLGLTAYHFARKLWGKPAALPALFLVLMEPNILAHGRYTTTDLGGTAFLYLATFLTWRMWQSETWEWRKWSWSAVGLGLAFGSKLSTLLFIPILGLMALLPIYATAGKEPYWRAAGRRCLQLGSAGLSSLLVLWAIFGFQWGDFHFRSQALSALNGASGPLPTFWAGLEQVAGLVDRGRGSAFLMGRFSDEGFLAYFPVAFLTKTPPILLLSLPLAAAILIKGKRTRASAIFLLFPALSFFLLSLQSSFNVGYRHLLPALPFLLVLVSGLARIPGPAARDALKAAPSTGSLLGLLPIVACAGVLVSDLMVHPHYLSYFNLVSGGPANGYRILVDSNIDWGQDLVRLQRWMGDNNVGEVNLAWFGSADPGYYDIAYRPLPGLGRDEFFRRWWDVPFDRTNPEPGIYAISVTNLWELPLRVEEKSVFSWFRERQPNDRVGYSILIYDVP